jgi:sugar phosphate isomerase/epimerase
MLNHHLGRRHFLAAAAAFGAAPRSFGATVDSADIALGFKLGLASYSLRKFSLDRTIDFCREAGIHYINLKDFHLPMTDAPEATAAGAKKVRDAGLTIMGGGTITLKNDPAQVRKAFEYAKSAGFPLIVAAPEPDSLDIVEKMIGEFGIKVAIHNHGPEDKFFPAPQDAMKRLQGRDPRFGLCMDVGHATRAGVDPVKAVVECKERLLDLHLKDLKNRTDRDSQTEVGKGVIDFPGLFRALKKIGYTGHAGLEYEINEADPFAGIRESFAYMRGVLAALGS